MTDKNDASKERDLWMVLAEVFSSQNLAVLATLGDEQPYCCLVGFAALPDMKHLLFATKRSTRKFSNISDNAHVAMMIDTRANKRSDFQRAIAVTAIGEAREVPKKAGSLQVDCYLDKHPDLAEFMLSPDCALLCVEISHYVIVQDFQQVSELNL